MADKCPLCRTDAAIRWRGPGHETDGQAVECPLCTTFEISESTLSELGSKSGDKELLPYLICHIRQANEPRFTVYNHTWRQFAQAHKSTPFSQKTAKLLDLFATRSNFQPGGRISVNRKLDWPLVDAGSEVELDYLLDCLLDEGYVNTKFEPQFQLTSKAWERFEKAGMGQGIPGRCFVAMSYDKSLNDAYDQGILLAVKTDCKMDSIRLDREQHNEKICDKIIADIRTCQFLIADVTLASQNVYFEAGFAMALNRPVIWTCSDASFEQDCRFDTRQYPYIRWKTPEDLRNQLAIRIKATIPGAV